MPISQLNKLDIAQQIAQPVENAFRQLKRKRTMLLREQFGEKKRVFSN